MEKTSFLFLFVCFLLLFIEISSIELKENENQIPNAKNSVLQKNHSLKKTASSGKNMQNNHKQLPETKEKTAKEKQKEKENSHKMTMMKKVKCLKNKQQNCGDFECCEKDVSICSRNPSEPNSKTCCTSTPLIDSDGQDWCCPAESREVTNQGQCCGELQTIFKSIQGMNEFCCASESTSVSNDGICIFGPTTFYVDDVNGNDESGSGSMAQPFKSIMGVLTSGNFKNGDIIQLLNNLIKSRDIKTEEIISISTIFSGSNNCAITLPIEDITDIQIFGQGIGSTTIECDNEFITNFGGKTQVQDVTVKRTKEGNPSFMSNWAANLTLIRVAVESTECGDCGGAIKVVQAAVYLDSCIFNGLKAGNGGVFCSTDSNVTSISTIYSNNEVTSSCFASFEPRGGAVYFAGAGTFSSTNDTFDSNLAEIRGGAVTIVSGDGQFRNASFLDNQVTGSAGGGAMYLSYSNSIIQDSKFERNLVPNGGGGVIYAEDSNVSSYYNVMTENVALAGGAIGILGAGKNFKSVGDFYDRNSAFLSSTIFASSLDSLEISNAKAIGTTSPTPILAAFLFVSNICNVKISDSIISDTQIGAVLIQNQLGVCVNSNSMEVTNTTFENILEFSLRYEADGSVRISNCSFLGKDDLTLSAGVILSGSQGQVTSGDMLIENSIFRFQKSTDWIDEGGGLLFNSKTASLTIDGCLFEKNEGSVFSTHVLAGTMSGSITIKNSQFLKNGKAVFISNDVAALKFSNCLFDGNIDDGFGSAIYLLQTNNPNIIVQIQSCNFTNNKGKQGGALAASMQSQTYKIEISDSIFSSNEAYYDQSGVGGSVFFDHVSASFLRTQFLDSLAWRGGAIYCINTHPNTLNIQIDSDCDTVVSRNRAYDASSIYNYGCNVYIPLGTCQNPVATLNPESGNYFQGANCAPYAAGGTLVVDGIQIVCTPTV